MNITYQEIEIKINVFFSEKQVRATTAHLDAEIKRALTRGFNAHTPEPMWVKECESAIQNAHLTIGTNVNWLKNEPEISQYIINKVKSRLPMGVDKIELMSLKEERHIYGNV